MRPNIKYTKIDIFSHFKIIDVIQIREQAVFTNKKRCPQLYNIGIRILN